jgi:PAS domain S-box-containing protein
LRGRSPEQGWKPESEWSDGIHPDDRGRVLRAVEAHFSDASKAFREEYRVSHADGHWVWIRDCGIAQWDGGGQVVRMVGWEEDISSRMQAEESVRASETLFRNLFDLHAAVKLLIDPETGAIVDANRAAVTYYGWSRDEICRMRIQEINMLSPDEVAREMQKAKEAHRNYFEFRHRRADGSIRDVAVFSSNVAGQGKSLLHSIVHDITEQKQADAALHAMLDEKTALLKEVHHRVKNNLQVVASLLGMQARRLDNAAARNVLRDSQSRVLSMALLHELLYRTGSLAHVDFDSYTERLCAALLRTVGPVAQRVRIERSVGDIRLPLEQAVPCGLIINELVTNALKHGYPDDRHGRVCIEMKVEDHRIRLGVSDDGAGLPDGLDINALPTLGLRLVQDLARQLQGAYRMERREGAEGGTAVSVVFPVKGWQDAGGST